MTVDSSIASFHFAPFGRFGSIPGLVVLIVASFCGVQACRTLTDTAATFGDRIAQVGQ